MSAKLTRKEKSVAAKYRKLVKAQEKAAANYELVDRLSFSIAQLAGGHGKTVRISAEGKALSVTDNYQAAISHPKRSDEQMPKAWAHGCVRQFDIKETQVPLEA